MTIWVRTPKLFESFTKKVVCFFNSVNVILIYRVHRPNAAAVQCAIMKPELSPPSLTRKAGSSLREGLHNLSILLSLIEANSWTAIDKKSRACEKRKCDARNQKNYNKHSKKKHILTLAGYSPWKFPPEIVSPLSAKTILEISQEKINNTDNLSIIEVVICDRDLFLWPKRIQGCQ